MRLKTEGCELYSSLVFFCYSRKKGKKVKKTKESCGVANERAENGNSELSEKLREQSKVLWKTVDTLKKIDLKKPDLIAILELNEQAVPTGIDKVFTSLIS